MRPPRPSLLARPDRPCLLLHRMGSGRSGSLPKDGVAPGWPGRLHQRHWQPPRPELGSVLGDLDRKLTQSIERRGLGSSFGGKHELHHRGRPIRGGHSLGDSLGLSETGQLGRVKSEALDGHASAPPSHFGPPLGPGVRMRKGFIALLGTARREWAPSATEAFRMVLEHMRFRRPGVRIEDQRGNPVSLFN